MSALYFKDPRVGMSRPPTALYRRPNVKGKSGKMERHEQKIQIILRYRSSPICSAWIKAATARAMIHQRAKKKQQQQTAVRQRVTHDGSKQESRDDPRAIRNKVASKCCNAKWSVAPVELNVIGRVMNYFRKTTFENFAIRGRWKK